MPKVYLNLVRKCTFFSLYFTLWKKAQREVRQHWFIYSYISAYIQALYMYVLSRVAKYIR
jgi:hypothetical protein